MNIKISFWGFGVLGFWGSGFAIIKIILISIGPLWIMFSRIALGSLVLLIWLYLQNKSLTFDKEFWFWSFIIGFLGFNFPFSIIARAIFHTELVICQ